jgi:hypothetical protein
MLNFVFILHLLLAAAPGGTAGAKPTADRDGLRDEVARLIGQLDSDRFEARRAAAERLEQLVAKPELGQFLAVAFQRVLVRPDLSFEVRWRLNRWKQQLPPPPPDPAASVSTKELDELVRRLDDDSYARRLGAAERLDWLLTNPKLICPVLLRLKQRLAAVAGGAEDRAQLEAAYGRARQAWLLGEPADGQLPAVSDEQIGAWLDDLVAAAPPANAAAAQRSETAERELLDLLARDPYVPRVTAALCGRLKRDPSAQAAAQLQSLLDWTKPAIVAEIWQRPSPEIQQGRGCALRQNFLVGVSTLWPNAPRPVLFDRVDERVAHCVSGNSLSPGDYPVGEAFPPPRLTGSPAFFYLVNLPTPRRRMAYSCYAETDEKKQLIAISRRTLDRVLADKRPLSESELLMLDGLDPTEVSRFAGKYFLLVDDSSLAAGGPPRPGGRPSRFGVICAYLAAEGTKDAIPGLTKAIAQERFLPATNHAPYRLHWLAALSIAARDPWPEVDAWLADRIGQSEPLVGSDASAPELGATAAALLLGRHGQSPGAFGLHLSADPLLIQLHVDGYRFDAAESRRKVQQWWIQKRAKQPATTSKDPDDDSTGGHSSLPRSPAGAAARPRPSAPAGAPPASPGRPAG